MRTGLVGLSVIMGFILLVCITNELEIFGVKFWGVRKEEERREKEMMNSFYSLYPLIIVPLCS
jgi:hypothetical protein